MFYRRCYNKMFKTVKIRLIPNKTQQHIFYKFVNARRYVYNWGLETYISMYKNGNKFIKMNDISKKLTLHKKEKTWLNDVGDKTLREALSSLDFAFKLFFNKTHGFPKFKSKKRCIPSFYTRYDQVKFDGNKVRFEKIGWVKYRDKRCFKNIKPLNTRILFDGKYWYLKFGIEINEKQVNLNQDLNIGIDLGIKELAVCSNGLRFKNINKTYKMKQLEKKLKRFQRQCSRKYEMNKQGNKFVKTKNIIKLEKKIKLIYRRMKNIRMNHIYQATNLIIKCFPNKIVMEDLNVIGMMKNKHLSKAIHEQLFRVFKEYIAFKSKYYNINFILADRWFPSSKTCSHCGSIKKDLKLSDRIYKCEHCGLEIDRDLNASINLSKL